MKNISDECMKAVNAVLSVYGFPELEPGHIVETHLGYYLVRAEKAMRAQEKRHPAGGWCDEVFAEQTAKWERLRAGKKVFMLTGFPRYFLYYVQDEMTGDALMRVITLWGDQGADAVRWVDLAWDGRYRLKPIIERSWEDKALRDGRRGEAQLKYWGVGNWTGGNAGMECVTTAHNLE